MDGLADLEVMRDVAELLVVSAVRPLLYLDDFIFICRRFRTEFRFDIVLALLKHAIEPEVGYITSLVVELNLLEVA